MSKTPKEIEEKVIFSYQEGIGTMELAKTFNLSRSTIQAILKRNDIPLRKTSPWRKKFNIHFFDNYTEESCYWAGFIAADGNVRSTRQEVNIHLSIEDYTHLEKFAQVINYIGKIEKSEKDCRIVISGSWYVDALEKNFNIIPQKTSILQFPTQMPKKFWNIYLRGYFDGDGCITYSNNNLHISITSGSIEFLNFCIEYFYGEGIRVRKNKNNESEKPKIYCNKTINYFLNNAKKILHLLYQNSTNLTRLDRKYKLYVNELVNI